MELNERIKALREEKHETQRQVALAVEITERQYQRFERGEQKPGFDNFCALAKHFGVTLDYLACLTDER